MNERWEILLDKFSLNSLNANEQKEFDELYASEQSFKEEADLITDLKVVAESKDQNDFKELLTSIEKNKHTTKKSTPKTLWLSAIAVAAILVVIFSIFNFNKRQTNEQLYAAYFSPHANTLAPVERGFSDLNPLEKALFAYENKQFEEAIVLFNQVNEKEYPDASFYKATALMANAQFDEAIAILNRYSQKNEKYSTYAHWYLALAYLKTNQQDLAKNQLQLIVNLQYYPPKKAEQLLQELD